MTFIQLRPETRSGDVLYGASDIALTISPTELSTTVFLSLRATRLAQRFGLLDIGSHVVGSKVCPNLRNQGDSVERCPVHRFALDNRRRRDALCHGVIADECIQAHEVDTAGIAGVLPGVVQHARASVS
jgi:hypothetical protein